MEITLASSGPHLAEWWYESRKDPETIRFNPLAPSIIETLRERLSQASSDLAQFEKCDSFAWVVLRGQEVLGHLTVQEINRTMLTAEIGYGVSRQARGQGIGTRAVQLLAREVFKLTPLRLM